MSQPTHPSTASLCGRPIGALFGATTSEQKRRVDLLDSALPLRGASHADVAEYRIETPMRYAECVAILLDGRKAGFLKAHQFVGWSADAPMKSLLFRNGDKHIELVIDARLQNDVAGGIRDVLLESPASNRAGVDKTFIGIDGELVTVPVPSASAHA